VQVKIKLMN